MIRMREKDMVRFFEKLKYNWMILLSSTIAAVIMIAYAVQLTVPVISDETVTMANGAYFAGYDWSMMIAATGGLYYKYLQALITIPIYWLTDDPSMVYRIIMILHGLIQTSIVPVVYCICRRHLNVKKQSIAVLLAMTACFVPATVLYVFYSRGDIFLGVLPWYVLLCFLETVRAAEKKENVRCVIFTLLATLFSILNYMAHTRGIILIVALIMSAILIRFFMKKRSLTWPVLFLMFLILAVLDDYVGNFLKTVLYSVGGANGNTAESINMGSFFNIYSVTIIKAGIMLCFSWMYTLCASSYGMVLIGLCVCVFLFFKGVIMKSDIATEEEKVATLFGLLVFLGYFVVGALFFKGIFTELSSGILKRRSDRMIYDRYAICGTSMLVFIAAYALTIKREWIKWKSKCFYILASIGIAGVFYWKILPLVTKYPGYLYNTIILNTFQKIEDPWTIMTGAPYGRTALLAMGLLGILGMIVLLRLGTFTKKQTAVVLLIVLLLGDMALIHVNYKKVRKVSNDVVVESTREVVSFLQEMDAITTEYPYVLKGGLSGVKIQYYQQQLMNYKFFGKNQIEIIDESNYFIVSAKDDINLNYHDEDYYLFEVFDYENADKDIIYIKGEKLKMKLESMGYKMLKYKG